MNKYITRPLPYVITAFLALLSGLFSLAVCHIYPFGENYLSLIDNIQLYATDFGSIKKIISGEDSPFFSFSAGGAIRSSLASTFSLSFFITWLAAFIPYEHALQAVSWAFLANWVFISLSALFYFKNTFKKLDNASCILLSLGYLFSAYTLTKYTFIPFYYQMGIFPIFLYCLDRLLDKGKCWGYVLLMVWLVGLATYFGYMYAVFAFVYAACRGFRFSPSLEHRPRPSHYVLLLWSTLFAVAVTAWLWLPSIIQTLDSARGGIAGKISWLYKGKILYEHFYLVLCVPVALALLLCVRNWSCRLFRSTYFVVFLFLSFCALFSIADSLWHGGSPIGFPVRYGFMIHLMLLAWVASMMTYGVSFQITWKRAICLTVAAFVLFAAYTQCGKYTHLSFDNNRLLVTVSVVFILAAVQKLGNHIYHYCGMIVVIPLLFLVDYNYNRSCRNNHFTKYEYSLENVFLPKWGEEQLQTAATPSAIRTKVHNAKLCCFYSEYTGLKSISNFFHTAQSAQQETMSSLGYLRHFTRISDFGGSLFSDALLAIKYIIANHADFDDTPVRQLAESGNQRVYENPFYWGCGFITTSAFSDKPQSSHPINVQEEFASLIIPNTQLFTQREASINTSVNGAEIQLSNNTGFDYILLGELRPWDIAEFKAGADESIFSFADRVPGDNKTLIHIPSQTQSMSLSWYRHSPKNVAPQKQITIYTLNLETARRLAQEAALSAPKMSYEGSRMTLECENKDSNAHLILPLFYDSLYAIEVNGNQVQGANCMGFLAVPLSQLGHQHITLTHTRPYQQKSMILACISGGILLLLYFFIRRRSFPKLEKVFFKLLAWGMLAVIAYVSLCTLWYSI